MKAALISLNKVDSNKKFVLGDFFQIGRSEDNDLVLPKKYISRRQATIHCQNGAFIIKDMGSRNPTIINNQAVKEHVLQHGDYLEICDFKFRVEMEENHAYVPPTFADDENTDGTTFVDMSRYVHEAPKEELGSVNQIQFSSNIELEEDSSPELLSLSPLSPSISPSFQKQTNPNAKKKSRATSSAFEPAVIEESEDDLEVEPMDFNATFEPAVIEESEDDLEVEPMEFNATFEPAVIEESEEDLEAEPMDFNATFEPAVIEESEEDLEAEPMDFEGSFSPEVIEESEEDFAAEPLEMDPPELNLSLEADDDEEILLPPPVNIPLEKSEPSHPPLPFMNPLDSPGDQDFEGTAIVDLSAVMATPPGLLEEEAPPEEPTVEPGGSFTGSLAELLARSKKSSASPAQEEEQGSSIKFIPPAEKKALLGDDDDDDEGTDVVEIKIDVDEDDDEGTDMVDPKAVREDGKDQTAQLQAVRGRRKKGKLASADSIGVSGAMEEEEEDDEYYLDPNDTGEFSAVQCSDKKKTQKKIEKMTMVGLCCISLLMALLVIRWLTHKGTVAVEKFRIKLTAKENMKKKWPNPKENRIVKMKIGLVSKGGKTKYKAIKSREGVIYKSKYLNIERILVPRNPTWFIFLPKKKLAKGQWFVLRLEYKNKSIQKLYITIDGAPTKMNPRKKFLKIYESLSKEEKQEEVVKLTEEADKLWYDRAMPGNEGQYEEAILRYRKALWLMETYRPNEFNATWQDKYVNLKNQLENAVKEKESFLKKLEGDFLRLAKQKKKRRVKAKLSQVLNLVGSDPRSPVYLRNSIYKDYLYKK